MNSLQCQMKQKYPVNYYISIRFSNIYATTDVVRATSSVGAWEQKMYNRQIIKTEFKYESVMFHSGKRNSSEHLRHGIWKWLRRWWNCWKATQEMMRLSSQIRNIKSCCSAFAEGMKGGGGVTEAQNPGSPEVSWNQFL